MPTVPAGEPLPSPREPHEHRSTAESFGSDAERYDRARPGYPEALVRRIVTGSPGRDVLDVGCGTGIAARQFRAAGCAVLGVEPDVRMAEVARRLGTEVEVSAFEAWESAGRRFDAVVAAQSWHWVDPVAGAAGAAGVLRPGGRFAAFWHVFGPPAEVAEATATACRRAMPDSPFDFAAMARPSTDPYRPVLDRTREGLYAAGGFGEPEEWSFAWERSYTRDAWLDVLPTQGTLTRLPAHALTGVLAEVGSAIDAMGGHFTLRFTTVAISAVRTDDRPDRPAPRAAAGRGGGRPARP
ncbi:class I SAM-dependent methyltransferase [Streptomyces sp. NPDC048200]|uniref:class I SAM-dependent methyltransferase n=1 Tax=Streptomyces sp. NPDC048200 TaxID=3365512 RepID=UPI00370F8EFF